MQGLLYGKVAVITGAGWGVGHAATALFVKHGAKVIAADIDAAAAQASAEAAGGGAIGVGCDVADEASVAAAVSRAAEAFGRLDIIYNNAGITASMGGERMRTVLDMTQADLDRVTAVNVNGVLYGARAAIARFETQGVVGIAGGPDKCRAVEAIGFDACVDYKAPGFAERLAAACPDRINVYVDNVGGPVTQTVMPLLAMKARMPVCGFISYYGVGMEGPGPDRMPGFLRLVMSRMLEVRGFGGAMTAGPQAITELAGWLRDGRIRNVQTVVEGLEAAPAAFARTFRGGNAHIGKLVVRVGAG